MLNKGNYSVLSLNITACDHPYILSKIKENIVKKRSLLISPLASQTFILALKNRGLKKVLDKYDYLFSDSIWVKRSINYLYNIKLKDRIRGSNLLLQVCKLCERENYKIYFYGTTDDTLNKLIKNISNMYPTIAIVGRKPSKFKVLTASEKSDLIKEIEMSGTDILLIALGSPLEQVFSYDLLYTNPKFKRPIIVIPFGAAFDFIAGVKPTAPEWMQKVGIEWFFRFLCEPRRLWRRYFVYGTLFILFVINQKIFLLFNLTNKIIGKSKTLR